MMKKSQPLQNRMNELRAKEQTLLTSDKADMAAINSNIDSITKISNQLMKVEALHQVQTRALLTDEQQIVFDRQNKHRSGMRPERGQNRQNKHVNKREKRNGMAGMGSRTEGPPVK
jgi:Spy/CpxP family protein refolding chaperone